MARRWSLIVALLMFSTLMLGAAEGQRFVAVSYHDVVDQAADLTPEAVTTDQLIVFFDWLKANHWTPVSIDDLLAAQRGERALPEHAIVLCFDDGFRSVYTRVYPLALAYHYPIVSALVGSWVDVPPGGSINYEGKPVPRERFISWNEAREMARSGLVEFASHSYAMHETLLGNPQGNLMPASSFRQYEPGVGYGSLEDFHTRIRADLKRSKELMTRQLGKPPRVIVWPYGRYNSEGLEAARELGMIVGFNLDPEPANTRDLLEIPRYLPTANPSLETIVMNLRFDDPLPAIRRVVRLDPAAIWSNDPAQTDARLGRVIERLIRLGATGVYIEGGVSTASGTISAVWFPNSELPVAGDLLSRLCWQLQKRVGLQTTVRLSPAAVMRTLGDRTRTLKIFRDLGAYAAVTGLVFDAGTPVLAPEDAVPGDRMYWTVRAARRAADEALLPPELALDLAAFRATERQRHSIIWIQYQSSGTWRPSALADFTWVRTPPSEVPRLLRGAKQSRQHGVWLNGAVSEQELMRRAREAGAAGVSGLGWDVDDSLTDTPRAAIVAPAVSAARFPAGR
jgi:biofilm PGA synthesis lipoprotein PgaB